MWLLRYAFQLVHQFWLDVFWCGLFTCIYLFWFFSWLHNYFLENICFFRSSALFWFIFVLGMFFCSFIFVFNCVSGRQYVSFFGWKMSIFLKWWIQSITPIIIIFILWLGSAIYWLISSNWYLLDFHSLPLLAFHWTDTVFPDVLKVIC